MSAEYYRHFKFKINWIYLLSLFELFPGAHVCVCELYKHKKTYSLAWLTAWSQSQKKKIYILKKNKKKEKEKIDWNPRLLSRDHIRRNATYTWICYKKHKKKNARNSQQKKMNLMAAPNCIKNFFNFLIDSFKRDIDRGKGLCLTCCIK